ncbi:uncharacterized protein LOC128232471 isoform X2 [Mya arenaria]|uniref:uncharacterized protein LOC128232471 isoform X2 n=1 Tax=Mya arenaria TaxID=6604 RepID=UPI0022E0C74A|nr:uncharacterized protein LOC128232471 isoform X2 [Mya arenaria]
MSVSFKPFIFYFYQIGFGCLRLLFAVFGVICSLAKVFVGAEYISACAARDIIPVYLVVSGCLPVLLVTLKEPYDATGNIHRHEAQLKVGVAVVAVAANLAWLIAGTFPLSGTVWTSLLLADSGYGGNLCTQETLCATPPPGEPDLSLDDLTKTTTGDGIFENKDKSSANISLLYTTNENISTDAGTNIQKQSNETQTHSFTAASWSNCTLVQEQDCIDCSKLVIFFSLACVVCDWVLFLVGSLYMMSFSCHKLSRRFKDNFLLVSQT